MVPRASARLFLFLIGLLGSEVARAQTVLTWNTASSGSWTTAGNWSGSLVPTSLTLHDAAISATGAAYAVTASGGSSLSVRKLDVSSANATLVFNFSSSGVSFSLGSATSTFSAGLVDYQTGNGIFGNGSANTTLAIASGAELRFSTSSGTRNLNSLTLNNGGLLQVTSGGLNLSSGAITNQSGGLIHANGAQITFQSGTSLANSGTLRATGSSGILRFNNTLTTANLGTVDLVSGGHAYLAGTLNNSSATLAVPGTGASYELLGGTITGGIIDSGALKFTNSGGTLDGATVTGNLALGSGEVLTLKNGAGFTGTATVTNGTFYLGSNLSALANSAFVFTGSGSYLSYTGSGPFTLSLPASTSLTRSGSGNTYVYDSIANSGNVTVSGGTLQFQSGTTLTNTTGATTTVTGSGSTLYLVGLANSGTLAVNNSGTVQLAGAFTTANLGTVTIASSGAVKLTGTLNNASANLTAPAGGAYTLAGGIITGGTIDSAALAASNSGGTLDGATVTGNLALGSGEVLTLKNGAGFTGTATVTNGTFYLGSNLSALANSAFVFTGSGSYLSYTGSGPFTLTLPSSTSLTRSGSGNTYVYDSIANSGNVTVSGGTLQFQSGTTLTNTTGATTTVTGSGSTLYLVGLANSGTLAVNNSGTVQLAGAFTTANLGTITVASGGTLNLTGTINNTSATLTAPSGGIYTLLNGTITGGTVGPGAIGFTSSGGYLNGATLNDDLTLPANSYVRFTSGTSFTGANATFGGNSGIYWQQTGTLTGKSLNFGSNGYIYVNGANNTLTLAASTTGTGEIDLTTDGSSGTAITNQGILNHTSGYGQIYAPTLNNSGAITHTSPNTYLIVGNTSSGYNTSNTGNITVNAIGASIYLDGNFDNTGGSLTATAGQFYFRGNNTTAHLNGGTLDIVNGAHAYLQGTLANTGATLNAPHTGTYELQGGTINAGTIAANALTFTGSGGYLDATTFTGDLTLPANSYVRFTNGTSFTGANATFGGNSGIYWQQTGTLAGKSLNFGSNAYIYVNGANNTLTLAASTTGTGEIELTTDGSSGTAITNQGILNHTSGYGQIYAPTLNNSGSITHTSPNTYLIVGNTSSGYNTSNTGNITVNATGASIYLDGNFDNTGGSLTATAGQFYFRGNNTTAHLNGGTLDIVNGAHAYLQGTLANTGATLNAPHTGVYELDGGTINGGTIAAGALSFTNSAGTLNGVTLLGSLALPTSSGVTFTNLTTFAGTTATLNSNAYLYWQQTDTLASKALTLGTNSLIYISGANHALTLDAGSTATGTVTIYSDGSSGSAFTNQGLITHTSGSGTIYAPTFVNTGTIVASGGSLSLGSSGTGYTFANNANAVVRLSGGNISLHAPVATPVTNLGKFDVQSGTLFTNAVLTNGSTGSIAGAGTINGGITFTGGTLAPGNSGIGTLTFSGGVFSITSATTLAAELGGATNDKILFVNPSGPVNLGSGLLTLSLTLLSTPTASTYNLMQITSGGSGISGTFAGLPSTGAMFTSSYLGTPYAFSINYQTNLISLNLVPVPEPSTYVLFGFGLLSVPFLRRRLRR